MKTIIKSRFLVLLLFLGGCNSWLDINPSDRISDEQLYSSTEGFLKSLNGIYVELNSPTVYGENLTASVIDVLGQYYTNYSGSTHKYYYYMNYSYTSNSTVKNTFDNIWSKMYELIANCNVLLEACEENGNIMSNTYFGIVKGEALALRAMLHFDVFRLYGPIYSSATQTDHAIPYVKTSDAVVTPLSTSEAVKEEIIKDLTGSLELLKDTDPIFEHGVRNYASEDGINDFYYRQYRMNYYAVKALLARVYLWFKLDSDAYTTATEILKEVQVEGSEIFPFVTNSAATNVNNPDRVFSTEVMFSLYNSNRINVYNNLFIYSLDNYNRLTFNGTLLSGRVPFTYANESDYRYNIWDVYPNSDGTDALYHKKFQDITNNTAISNAFRFMMPLIRLSEVYLIATETSENLTEATRYLNTLRLNRNCLDLFPNNQTELMTFITNEYRKEFLGEGQMFFYYKRRAMQSIPNGMTDQDNLTMNLNNYVVPLPDSETSQRVDIE